MKYNLKYKFLKSHRSANIYYFKKDGHTSVKYTTGDDEYCLNDIVIESDKTLDDLLIDISTSYGYYGIISKYECINLKDVVGIQAECRYAIGLHNGVKAKQFNYCIFYNSAKYSVNYKVKFSLNNIKYLQMINKKLFNEVQTQILKYYSDDDLLLKEDKKIMEYCISQLPEEKQLLYIIK